MRRVSDLAWNPELEYALRALGPPFRQPKQILIPLPLIVLSTGVDRVLGGIPAVGEFYQELVPSLNFLFFHLELWKS